MTARQLTEDDLINDCIPESLIKKLERVWERTQVNHDGCWVYLRRRSYPAIMIDGKSQILTRYLYQEINGWNPTGLVACHICDNTCCIRPLHIYMASQKENVRDRIRKGRQLVYKGKGKVNS